MSGAAPEAPPAGVSPEIEAHVLGHPKGDGAEGRSGQLGACPFSMRVLLTLEEKGIPYTPNFINPHNKPAWLAEVSPENKVPVIKDLASGEFIADSDAIVDYLEARDEESGAPRKRLGRSGDAPVPAPDLMPRLMDYLRAEAGGGEEEAPADALLGQLKEVEAVVSDDRPYLGGKDASAADLALGPKLFIARTACHEIKGWDFGDDLPQVKAYLHRLTGRPSWRNSASWDADSIAADLRAKLA